MTTGAMRVFGVKLKSNYDDIGQAVATGEIPAGMGGGDDGTCQGDPESCQ
jgi:hypothetical protein